MVKKVTVLSICLLLACVLNAQDIITKNDGTDIQAKVLEVGQSQVSYKKTSNPDGPTYTIGVSDILMITYENGEREMYNTANEAQKVQSLPQGVMTYNQWSGKISVGGVTIENEMLDMYFTPDDLKLYNRGKTNSILGTVVGCIGAFPFGWCLGNYASGSEYTDNNQSVLIGSGIAMITGIIIGSIGEKQRKTAVSNYNHSSLAFQPELHLVTTGSDIGIGVALVF